MNGQKEDRRTRITKQAIRESLVELLQEYPLSKISVKMICETADINRSTFYVHYTDQYDLLQRLQEEVMNGLSVQILSANLTAQSESIVPVLMQILEYAKKNATLFKVALGENNDSTFWNTLRFIARQKVLQEISEDKRLDETTASYLETFAVAGYISIIRRWLDSGCEDDPGQLCELMSKLLFQVILSAYPR